jgi:hypothetical protein
VVVAVEVVAVEVVAVEVVAVEVVAVEVAAGAPVEEWFAEEDEDGDKVGDDLDFTEGVVIGDIRITMGIRHRLQLV